MAIKSFVGTINEERTEGRLIDKVFLEGAYIG